MNALFKFQEDYLVGVSNGLDLSCAVGEDGRYEAKLDPELSGLDILGEGSEKVLTINSFQLQYLTKMFLLKRFSNYWATPSCGAPPSCTPTRATGGPRNL